MIFIMESYFLLFRLPAHYNNSAILKNQTYPLIFNFTLKLRFITLKSYRNDNQS